MLPKIGQKTGTKVGSMFWQSILFIPTRNYEASAKISRDSEWDVSTCLDLTPGTNLHWGVDGAVCGSAVRHNQVRRGWYTWPAGGQATRTRCEDL